MGYPSQGEKKEKKEILIHQVNGDSITQISVEPIDCNCYWENKILLVPKVKQSIVYYEVKLLCSVLPKSGFSYQD